MLLSTTFNLERIECIAEHDNFGAEPYLWTAFFHADTSTISNTSVADTVVPIANDAGRSLIANGVDEGESVIIPASIGRRSFTVDTSGRATVGVLFALLEENWTSTAAMAAGQLEFRAAFDELLDLFILTHLGEEELPDEDLAILAGQIRARVVAKIKASGSFTDYFKPRDRFIGFGLHVLSRDELVELAQRPTASHTFSATIRGPLTLPGSGHAPPTTLFEEYRVSGRVRARMLPPDVGPSQQGAYYAAVAQFEKINRAIVASGDDVRRAPRRERRELKEQLRHQESVVFARASETVEAARRDYYEFVAHTTAGKALAEERADRQRRLAERRGSAPTLFGASPITVARARILTEPRASQAAPIDGSTDREHARVTRDLTG